MYCKNNKLKDFFFFFPFSLGVYFASIVNRLMKAVDVVLSNVSL